MRMIRLAVVLVVLVTACEFGDERPRDEVVADQERHQAALDVVLVEAFGSGSLTEWTEVPDTLRLCSLTSGTLLMTAMTLDGTFGLESSYAAFVEAIGDKADVTDMVETAADTAWDFRARDDSMAGSGAMFWDEGALRVRIDGGCYADGD